MSIILNANKMSTYGISHNVDFIKHIYKYGNLLPSVSIPKLGINLMTTNNNNAIDVGLKKVKNILILLRFNSFL